MTRAVSPACAGTSVKCARNGIPEGLPRGRGFTLRGVTPCPRASVDAAVIHKKSRREIWALFILDRSSLYLSCIIALLAKESRVTAAAWEQRPRKPSGSANLPFCCAAPSSWQTPQLPFAFAPRACRAGRCDSERRAVLDRASRLAQKQRSPPDSCFGQHRCGQDRGRRAEGLSAIAWLW